jgi:hypothetical protein
MQHGNEWGPLLVLLELLPWLRSSQELAARNSYLTVILGNPRAAAICDRFIDLDLNRCYPDPHKSPALEGDETGSSGTVPYEILRAGQIAGVVASADMVLDLHQTNQDTREPFFVFPFHERSVVLARQIGTSRFLLTRPVGEGEAGRCVDDFLQGLDIPAVVIEVGARGENTMSRDCAMASIRAFFRLFAGQVGDVEHADLRLLRITRRYDFSSRKDAVSEGLINLSPVGRGTPLLTEQHAATAPRDGFVVFVQRPRRNPDGQIAGRIPATALCFAEDFVRSDVARS